MAEENYFYAGVADARFTKIAYELPSEEVSVAATDGADYVAGVAMGWIDVDAKSAYEGCFPADQKYVDALVEYGKVFPTGDSVKLKQIQDVLDM